MAARGQAIILVEYTLRGSLGLGVGVQQIPSHQEILLHCHVREHGLVLQDIGDTRLFQLAIGSEVRDVSLVAALSDCDLPAIDLRESVDGMQYGRLAGSVWSD